MLACKNCAIGQDYATTLIQNGVQQTLSTISVTTYMSIVLRFVAFVFFFLLLNKLFKRISWSTRYISGLCIRACVSMAIRTSALRRTIQRTGRRIAGTALNTVYARPRFRSDHNWAKIGIYKDVLKYSDIHVRFWTASPWNQSCFMVLHILIGNLVWSYLLNPTTYGHRTCTVGTNFHILELADLWVVPLHVVF